VVLDDLAAWGDRDAWAIIRGYVYQVRCTVLRWLALDADTTLLCEWGEDLALVRNLDAGEAAESEVVLEQIKYRAKRVTLRTPAVVDTLARFYEVRKDRRGMRLMLRFTTNAMPGRRRQAVAQGRPVVRQ
jgi:hypothetical protein